MQGMLRGRFLPFFFGIYILRKGLHGFRFVCPLSPAFSDALRLRFLILPEAGKKECRASVFHVNNNIQV
jgi:hypothetical protein